MVLSGAVGSNFEARGSGSVAEGSPTVGRSSGDIGGSGAGGGDVEPIGSPPRNSARVTSSSHVPITKYDVAEHLPDEMLARLLEDNPLIGEMVLKAKEERARAIAASEAAERA
ncbi:hypothetical protein RHMOL_Rhmol05G0147200 [Rhododendron molle]|uniref:Uncharacterized protein n=1 Tax=Rhododendron molle TaxID=49168 RepID=A0ACC0NQ56_RHOML|nr:hypothetical protein RHMOL_Rhmol05G0147200 [Rhododendron molle]